MNYAVDINSHRIKKAMLNLGLEPQELMVKDLEDFSSKDITEEIKNLRYNYYCKKQQDLVQKIKEMVRHDLQNSFQKNKLHHVVKKSLTSTFEHTETSDELEKIKEKHNRQISAVLQSVQNSLKETQAIQEKLKNKEKAREKIISEVIKKKDKNLEFREKQQENYKKIKSIERKKAYFNRNCFSITPNKSISKKMSLDFGNMDAKSEPDYEHEIITKIEKYEEKMKRSNVIYQFCMESKRKAAAKLIEKAETTTKAILSAKKANIEDKIAKMFMKSKAAEDRRISLIKEQSESFMKRKKISVERRELASERLKQQEILSTKKAKAIEKRMEISNKILEQKHLNWAKELQIRIEFQRLKDEEALNNIERKKRVM
jgi:hypothetical protein